MSLAECPYCDESITFLERTQDATTSTHHNCVYFCENCDITVVSG